MFDWYPGYEYLFARTQLVLFTLGMGITLSLGDFVEIARRPRSFLSGLLGQIFVIPLFAVVINATFGLEGGIAVGMILVAAMPGGALSKFFAYFGRGNMALSISLTGVSTLLSLLTVPAMLQLLATQYTADFVMPVADVMIDVALCLLLPLVVGLTLGRLVPRHRQILSNICIRIGLAVVIVMVAGSLGSGRIKPLEYGLRVPLAIILFCLLGQQVNMFPFRLFGWPRADRMAVGIEITMRNMNLALLISARLFPPPDPVGGGVLFVILFYAGAAMGVGLPLAWNHRRMAQRETSEAIQPVET
ncbi:MAG: bile acid:sodium symporter family protein [Planctomycetes bacterium]|jgi:BASS family bile acid:Na+ symporter|nr:bile acid:sodium symporter family protein [Planctomycetota bacterium]